MKNMVCVITRSKAENPPVSDSKAIDFERPTLKSSHYRFQDRDSPDEYGWDTIRGWVAKLICAHQVCARIDRAISKAVPVKNRRFFTISPRFFHFLLAFKPRLNLNIQLAFNYFFIVQRSKRVRAKWSSAGKQSKVYEQQIRGIAGERIDRGTFTFTRGSVGTTQPAAHNVSSHSR